MNPLLKLALQVGVPAAIAVYLVWILASTVTTEVRQSVQLLEQHTAATEKMRSALEEQHIGQATVIMLLRQMCVNGARTNADRGACFGPPQ